MKGFNIGDTVVFQAYEENTPINGRIKRIGTLKELDRHQLDDEDKRIFYELETIEDRPTIFTVTTISWINKKK